MSRRRYGHGAVRRALRTVALSLLAAAAFGQTTAGRLPTGAAILPNGWPITPAGRQIELSTLPMSVVSADGKTAIALNSGFAAPSLDIVDLGSGGKIGSTLLAGGWLGLTLDRSGRRLYVGGGASGAVYAFGVGAGKLRPAAQWTVAPARGSALSFLGDVRLDADERFLYVADLLGDRVTALNLQTGVPVTTFKTGPRPYRLRLGQRGATMWISHWGDSTVGMYSLPDGRLLERVRVGGLPTDLLLVEGAVETAEEEGPQITARLFVACANTNSVWVFGLTEGDRVRLLERIPVLPGAETPLGAAPTALALGADGESLYIVCSGLNAILIADISGARTELVGALPTGWRPTAVETLPDGGLVYLNGKGGGSWPAPLGPDPTNRGRQADYVASLQIGSLGIVPRLTDEDLAGATERYLENLQYDDSLLDRAGVPADNPIPNGPEGSSPVRHVIYVIKENRTYDQLFGDLDAGSGEKELTVFGEKIAPNHRKLAREFALFDNFYAAGDVSADGWSWATGAMATDFVQKLWPAAYARRLELDLFGRGEPAAEPPAGTLWSNAAAAGMAVRTYGIPWPAGMEKPAYVADAPGFDLDTTDTTRVDAFLADFDRLLAADSLPRLMVLRLPNDHTAGRTPGAPTPAAMMAEHDAALGKLVERVSESAAWPATAIFVVEDDAQDGADHVDSHRSVALLASPWAKRGGVDNTFYSTLSVLRTIELILGLRPMTLFDAAATPMWKAFTAEPDNRPYEAKTPKQQFDERNPPGEGGRQRRVEAQPRGLRSAD